MRRKLILTTLCLLFSVVGLFAQQPFGTPIFGTYQQRLPNLSIDLGNLNVHTEIPVWSRASVGDNPFFYNWGTENEIWKINAGGWTQVAGTWEGTPVPSQSNIGYGSVYQGTCPDGTKTYQVSGVVVVDTNNTTHAFPTIKVQNDCPATGWTKTASAYSIDGYYAYADYSTNTLKITAYTPNGTKFVLGTSAATDRNGNVDSANYNVIPSLYYDPLSTTTPVLTYDYSHEPSYDTLTYTGEGGNETVTKHFTQYYLASGPYGCSATQMVATSQTIWTTSFSRPDGSSYTIGYEQTPGKTAAYITGRINKLILPTGGIITISYSGSNYGMNCDGSTSGMDITSPDGTWHYTHTAPSGTYHLDTTTITDPYGNKTVYTFTQASVSSTPYEVQRQIYTGASTLIKTVITCYNGQTTNCNTAPNAINTVSQITRYTQLPDSSGVESETHEYYDGYARLTELDEYDYGQIGGAPGPLLRKTLYSYGSWNGSGCSGLSGNILNAPCSVVVSNGTTNLLTTHYTRDARGNAITISSTASGASVAHTQSYSYNANGTVATFADVNGDSYSYTYGYCNGAFTSSISEPASLSKSMVWNCSGSVMTSITDEAGKTKTLNHSGEYFWRPSSAVDAMGSTTSFYYTPTTVESVLNFGSSTVDRLTTFDGLGRVHVSQKRQAPGSSSFDSVETDYNAAGQLYRVTQPYQATAGATNGAAPSTTYTNYDGLGRVGTITDGGSGVTNYLYVRNIMKKLISPAFAGGSSNSSWGYVYDGLGRLTDACEGDGGTGGGISGSVPCTFISGWYGYWSQYTYDAIGDLTGSTQNVNTGQPQSRSFTYDGFGRMTSETNPESGTTSKTYVYDTQTVGDLYTSHDQNGVTITYTHGPLHRLQTANAGGTYCRNFTYDQANARSGANNVNGRLAHAWTANCTGTVYADEYFGYDANGRSTDLWESTTNSGGFYHVVDQYYPNGVVNTLLAYQSSGVLITGLPTITYGVDAEGRATTVTAGSGQNPVTAASYYTTTGAGQSLGQLASITLGSGDSDSYQYDQNTGRMTQYKFSINGSDVIGNLTWNANNTLQQLAITDPFNSSNVQTCAYGYDAIARLINTNCGTPWSQSFTYDFAGNLKKSGSLSFQPNYTDANSYTNNRYYSGLPGLSYDADGDLLNDSFHTYTWDAFGGVSAIGSFPITHDAFGRIVEFKSSPSYQVLYAPSGIDLAVMNGQTIFYAKVPMPNGGRAVFTGSGLNDYTHVDWQGSARFSSTPSRGMLFDMAYAPYGEIYAKTGGGSAEAFTDKYRDIVSDIWDFPMRGEHSSQGRWISPDPAGLAAVSPMNPQTWNRYAYVGGNPLSAIDPLGLFSNAPALAATDLVEGSIIVEVGSGSGCVQCNKSLTARQDTGGTGLNKAIGTDAANNSVWQTIKNIARMVGNYIPTVCGGGVFNYGGLRVSGDVASVSVSQIRMADTRSGYSEAPFADISFGEGLMGGYGQAVFNSGENEHFLFGGAGGDVGVTKASVSVFGSHVSGSSIFQNSIGLNGDAGFLAFTGGVGVYANTDSVTSCIDHSGS